MKRAETERRRKDRAKQSVLLMGKARRIMGLCEKGCCSVWISIERGRTKEFIFLKQIKQLGVRNAWPVFIGR